MVEIIFNREAPERIDKFLAGFYKEIPRSYFQKLISFGKVKVNENLVDKDYKLNFGDKIKVEFTEEKKQDFEIPLETIYEDDYLAVINKPAGIVVHPAKGHRGDTILDLIFKKYLLLKKEHWEGRPVIVHRLDKDTSGALLIAKTYLVQKSLMLQFQERKIKKVYLGIVHGNFTEKQGIIEGAVTKSRRSMKSRISPVGKPAVTEFKVKKQVKGYSLLEIYPLTGRTHQIRLHLSNIGHPVIGDRLYSRDYDEKVERCMLHAYKVGFLHPVYKRIINVKAALPNDFTMVLKCFGF